MDGSKLLLQQKQDMGKKIEQEKGQPFLYTNTTSLHRKTVTNNWYGNVASRPEKWTNRFNG